MSFEMILGLAIVVLAAMSAVVLQAERFVRRSKDADLRELLALLQGDRATASRLCDYERERAPGIGNDRAIARALVRLRRDRAR